MTNIATTRAENLKDGDVLVLGPIRMPVAGVTHEAGKTLVTKVNASPYPLVYSRGTLVRILKARGR
jgi:hypothetical protein